MMHDVYRSVLLQSGGVGWECENFLFLADFFWRTRELIIGICSDGISQSKQANVGIEI